MELRGDRARRPDFVVLPPPHDRFFTRGALSRWHNRSGPRHGDADVDPRWSTTPAHFDLLFDAFDVRRVELDVPDQDMYRGSRACRWHRRGACARLPDIDSDARHSFAATEVHALQALPHPPGRRLPLRAGHARTPTSGDRYWFESAAR